MVTRKRKPPFVFSCSVIGESHVKSGKPCQDSSLSLTGKKFAFVAVADGHGGDQYFRSDAGSRFALEAAQACMTDTAVIKALKVAKSVEVDRILYQLKRSIVGRWNTLVIEHLDGNPFTEEELAGTPRKYADRYSAGEQVESAYGTTLIAVLWTDFFFLALQIGDGNCMILNREGLFSQPIPADDKCFLNKTTSLCDENAAGEIRHYFSDALATAVVIGSDGIDDCFVGEEKLLDFYRVILSSFLEKDEETAAAELIDYLPRMSEKGSGDDMSIGFIMNKNLLLPLLIDTADIGEEGVADDGESNIGKGQTRGL